MPILAACRVLIRQGVCISRPSARGPSLANRCSQHAILLFGRAAAMELVRPGHFRLLCSLFLLISPSASACRSSLVHCSQVYRAAVVSWEGTAAPAACAVVFWGVWEQQPAAEGNVSKRKATTYSSYAATDLLMFPIWFRGLIKLFATDRIKEWKYKLGFSQNQVKVLIQIFTFEFVSYNYQESWWFCSFRSYSTARPALNT